MPRYPQLPRKTEGGEFGRRRLLAWAMYASIIIFFIVCLFWLRAIILPFVIALLIAFILEPFVTKLHGFGLPRWLGVILVYITLIGAVAIFLTYLVPIIDKESKNFVEKFNILMRKAPQMYEHLETGVGEVLDGLIGEGETVTGEELRDLAVREDEWGFGPPVYRIPTITPSAVSGIRQLGFGSMPQDLEAAGLPDSPDAGSMRLEGGKALVTEEKDRRSSLLIEQVQPGKFGVSLGTASVEVRKVGEGTYVLSSKEQSMETPRSGDIKNQVIAAMRKGLQETSASALGGLFTFFQGLVTGLMNALVGLVVVLLVGAFAMIDGPRIMAGIRSNFPGRYREDLDDLLKRLNDGLAGVVRGQLLICLVNGVLSTIGFLIFIPEYAVVLGVLAGTLSLVPIFGTIISSIPAVLVALSIGFGHALGVLGWILGIHFVEAYILNPNIIGRQASIHPIVVVFVLIAGEHLYGMKGVLLAVPAASMVQSFIQFGYSRARKYVL